MWGSVLDGLERVVKILRRHVRQTSWIQRNLMSNFIVYEDRLGLSGVVNFINFQTLHGYPGSFTFGGWAQ